MRFSRDQRKQLADILGNIAVVWLSGGIISPIFFRQENYQFLFQNLIIGLFFGFLFGLISLIVLAR